MTPAPWSWTVLAIVTLQLAMARLATAGNSNTTELFRFARATPNPYRYAVERGYDPHEYYHTEPPPPPPPPKEQPKSDAVHSYYEFLINEGSYKFWAVFEVLTAALLIYSAFAAVYYARFTYATADYTDYDDDFFFKRSGDAYTTPSPAGDTFLGLSADTFQRIMDAISSKKYS